MGKGRFTGVFLNPFFVQDEGLGPVFDRLEKMGATAIVTHPRVAVPVEEGEGKRFPDLHGDGHRRVLARPLWGKPALHLKSGLSFEPNRRLFGKTPYAPPAFDPPPGVDLEIPSKILREARSRGMQAHLLMHPFLPAQPRTEDLPVFVGGSRSSRGRFSGNVCLNSPAAFEYGLAMVADILDHFPELDGLMPDWVEFGAYQLESVFTCFCPHCEAEARQSGFDWDAMKRDVGAAWDWLHALEPGRVASLTGADGGALREAVETRPGLAEFVRFKAHTVRRFYRALRQMLVARGKGDLLLTSRGWPPPWNRASGMSYGQLTEFCQVAAPKLFTFDYCALPRWYGEVIAKWNPGLGERTILDMLVAVMDLPDAIEDRSFEHYHIPAPDVPHMAGVSCYGPRITEVAEAVRPAARLCPFTHAYLPLPQWRELLTMMRRLPVDGIWIQMYGYLSDDKMDAVREIWNDA